MDLLQRQTFRLWFNWLGNKVSEWHEAKPANTDIKNCIKALSEIGMFTNGLQNEVEVLRKRITLIRETKNTLIKNQKKQIEELQDKLKQYDINITDYDEEQN